MDYCKERGVDCDVFADASSAQGRTWKAFYDRLFGPNEWRSPRNADLSSYDAIVLLTDDDPTFATVRDVDSVRRRTVCMDHDSPTRTASCAAHVAVRPHGDERPSLLPAYFVPSVPKYDDGKIHVALIGSAHVPDSRDFVESTFVDASECVFHVFNRQVPSDVVAQNVHVHPAADTAHMVDTLAACHVCFCRDSTVKPYTRLLSAAIPLAISTGTRLALSQSWNESGYELTSAFVYASYPVRLRDVYETIDDGAIREERQRWILCRNAAMDRALARIST